MIIKTSQMSTGLPFFWKSEVKIGKELGKGSYCEVFRVTDILLSDGDSSSNSEGSICHLRQRLARRFLEERKREKPSKQEAAELAIYGKPRGPPTEIDDPEIEPAPQLALKRIRRDELPSGQLKTAQDDFQRELGILLELTKRSSNESSSHSSSSSTEPVLPHANIIQLFGIGFDDSFNATRKSFSQDLQPSFLLLSQIRSTLSQRLVKWRGEKGLGIYEALSLDLNNRRNQWVERLLVVSRVAHAIQHLHHHQILYRDIKPANTGFDALDVPKLFDFGLAKVLSDDMRYRNENQKNLEDPLDEGFFHLTPETGTLRYMAIEVGKGRPYGWSADVYSLAILMHEVLSLEVPFGGVAPRQFRQVTWNQGQELAMDPSWPTTLQKLLPQMWHSDPTERPTIHEVVETVDGMLRGSDQDLFPRAMITRGRRFSLF